MTPKEKLVARMRLAALSGLYSGLIETPGAKDYIKRCSASIVDRAGMDSGILTVLLFTRDTGHHSSGWWKNPDYERCWHLSVSFRDWATNQPKPFISSAGRAWARLFFGDNARWLWVEGPYSELGKRNDVYHYRLFADEGWQPLKPRGEVYSKDWTPAGWMSFSEAHGERAAANVAHGPLGSPPAGE